MSATEPAGTQRKAGGPLADAESLLALTERLTGTIAAETALLATRPARELAQTQDEKLRLATLYSREMSALAADPERIARIDPALRDRLRDATRRFHQVAEEHSLRVRSLRTVSERMIKAIADEVTRRNRPVRSYDDKALMRPVAMSGMPVRPTSLALNQMV